VAEESTRAGGLVKCRDGRKGRRQVLVVVLIFVLVLRRILADEPLSGGGD
jgi:hypothetical protein